MDREALFTLPALDGALGGTQIGGDFLPRSEAIFGWMGLPRAVGRAFHELVTGNYINGLRLVSLIVVNTDLEAGGYWRALAADFD